MQFCYYPMELKMKEMHISMQHLKTQAQLNESHISKIASGELLDLETLMRLCQYFHCPITELIFIRDVEAPLRKNANMIRKYSYKSNL